MERWQQLGYDSYGAWRRATAAASAFAAAQRKSQNEREKGNQKSNDAGAQSSADDKKICKVCGKPKGQHRNR